MQTISEEDGNRYEGFARVCCNDQRKIVIERWFTVNGLALPTSRITPGPVEMGSPGLNSFMEPYLESEASSHERESLSLAHAVLTYEFALERGSTEAKAIADRYYVNFQTQQVRHWLSSVDTLQRQYLGTNDTFMEWKFTGKQVREWFRRYLDSHQKIKGARMSTA